MTRHTTIYLGWAAATAILLLAGCTAPPGQGKYTAAAAKQAELANRGMKAAAAYDNARQRFLAGDLKEALALANSAVELNPDVKESHLLRIRILLEMGKDDETRQAVVDAAKVSLDDARFPYYEGLLHERTGRNEDALHCYLTAAKLEPASVQYRIAAAEMMIELGHLDDAATYLEAEIKLHPNAPGLLQTRGYLARLEGRNDEAVRFLSEAATLAPDQPRLAEDLAQTMFEAGRYREALQCLRPLLDTPSCGTGTETQRLAVQCLLATDHPVEAREILRKVLQGPGDKPYWAWEAMAHVAILLGDMMQLHEAAARMIAQQPRRPAGYMAMALYQKNAGEVDSAIATLYHGRQVAGPSDLLDRCLVEVRTPPINHKTISGSADEGAGHGLGGQKQ